MGCHQRQAFHHRRGPVIPPVRPKDMASFPLNLIMHRSNIIATTLATLSVAGVVCGADAPLSFTNDVLPHLVKAGCASGNCHAKPEGQNGFKLSVFGYDPRHDYEEMVRDNRGRRVFAAAPEESLLVLKAIGAIPHEGGKRIEPGSEAYQALIRWIREGAKYSTGEEAKLLSIAASPHLEVYKKGAQQQLKVVAMYSDDSTRDVTHLADYLSQHSDIATVSDSGTIQVGSLSGEGVLVVRYMGHVDMVRITVPTDETLPDSLYANLPVNNEIDRLVYARHRKLGLLASDPCNDETFLRRASLDLTGRLPSAELARQFIADSRPDKRERLVETLLEDPNYSDHWAVKWGDLIRPNPSRVGVKPVYLLDQWIRDSFRQNKPYDQMVRELLTAEGSSHQYGPVAMLRDKRDPVDTSAFVSQIFLGVRLDCAKCHHHPSEKWTQEDYYQLAAFFAQMKRKGQGISAPISGEAEYWWYGGSGSVLHPITEVAMTPKPPTGPEMPYVAGQDPRVALADWMTSSENPFFAKAFVNRVWSELLGRGIVDPVDDFRVSNPPTNEALLEWLAQDFIAHGFNIKHLLRTITTSHIYQLSSEPNHYNVADTQNYSRFLKRRMSAEVLLDAVNDVVGVKDQFVGMPAGSRAVQTWNHKLPSDFMDAFGRPNASLECPCERDRKSSVVQALHLMNSSNLQNKLSSEKSRISELLSKEMSDIDLITEVYLSTYNRLPGEEELRTALRFFSSAGNTRRSATEDLAWSLINSAEFVFNH
jgi:hypothetical protein